MKLHQIECDRCGANEDLKNNREHWVPREGWLGLHEIASSKELDFDICPTCARTIREPLERLAPEKPC